MSQLLNPTPPPPALHRRGAQVLPPPPPHLSAGAAPAVATAAWRGDFQERLPAPPRLVPSRRAVSAQGQRPSTTTERDATDCVIVNPLAPPLDRTGVTSGYYYYGEEPPRRIPRPIPTDTAPAAVRSSGDQEEEPIYAEIRIPPEELKDPVEGRVLKNQLTAVEGSGRKGVEYWQITTKEMAKFRPCTQVIIRR